MLEVPKQTRGGGRGDYVTNYLRRVKFGRKLDQ